MLPLFPLLFLAVTTAPAGLLGKMWTPRALKEQLLTFSLIVVISSVVAVTPETVAALLHLLIAAPNNLSLLVDLALYQVQAVVAASLFTGVGWATATGIQCIFDDFT